MLFHTSYNEKSLQENFQTLLIVPQDIPNKILNLGRLCLSLPVSIGLRTIDTTTDPLLQMLQASYSLHWCCSAHFVPCYSCSWRILLHAFDWRNICQPIVNSWIMGGHKIIRRRCIEVLLWVILHWNSGICWCIRRASIKWMHACCGYLWHGLEQRVQSSNSLDGLFSHLHLEI